MRRADRLFLIIQILQRKKTAITATEIAAELETSVRTIYRDIQDLMKNHVPVVGERGTGYLLQQGYHLPPLMFSDEEIDAVMLGVEWVRANGDPELQRAAIDVLTKIGAVLPQSRQTLVSQMRQIIHRDEEPAAITISMPTVRTAMRTQVKADTEYEALSGEVTFRRLSPLVIVFFQNLQLLVTWCDLRNDIRNFRLDRFRRFQLTDESFSPSRYRDLEVHMQSEQKKHR